MRCKRANGPSQFLIPFPQKDRAHPNVAFHTALPLPPANENVHYHACAVPTTRLFDGNAVRVYQSTSAHASLHSLALAARLGSNEREGFGVLLHDSQNKVKKVGGEKRGGTSALETWNPEARNIHNQSRALCCRQGQSGRRSDDVLNGTRVSPNKPCLAG